MFEDGMKSGNWTLVAHLYITFILSLRARTVLGSQLTPLPTEGRSLSDDKMTPFRYSHEDLYAILTITL